MYLSVRQFPLIMILFVYCVVNSRPGKCFAGGRSLLLSSSRPTSISLHTSAALLVPFSVKFVRVFDLPIHSTLYLSCLLIGLSFLPIHINSAFVFMVMVILINANSLTSCLSLELFA